ncbi:MAG: tRNA (guanosine(46)-N7)-methyltransferase TrmB [Peptococcaceae bacterium]|nr:tRNA (guanosine(46)-N7)-methyltransferase TrmB [Peptococcaceae bacterium]MDH7524590.1 tRNA (guanosine(46)-N7)-methyltransferase TrmB [Peptococcaceae bacterium]
MRLRRKRGIEQQIERKRHLIMSGLHELRGTWAEVFGNERPLHVELGTGKGAFLAALARACPAINYVGVERVPEIIYQAAVKIEAGGTGNVRLLLADAESLPFYFNPGEIERIYLNFSDPWPKKRHAKRRLTSPRFLDVYMKLLKKGGEIHLKTDNRDFFEYSLETLAGAGFSLQKITFDLHGSLAGGSVMTEYEQKFVKQGKPICRCEAISPLF